jgi:hypothetical protein
MAWSRSWSSSLVKSTFDVAAVVRLQGRPAATSQQPRAQYSPGRRESPPVELDQSPPMATALEPEIPPVT